MGRLSLESASDRRQALVLLNGYVLAPELAAEGIERRSAEAIRAFNAMVAADDRVESLMLPIADGLTIVRKK